MSPILSSLARFRRPRHGARQGAGATEADLGARTNPARQAEPPLLDIRDAELEGQLRPLLRPDGAAERRAWSQNALPQGRRDGAQAAGGEPAQGEDPPARQLPLRAPQPACSPYQHALAGPCPVDPQRAWQP